MKKKKEIAPIELDTIDVKNYETISNSFDLRKDMHVFTDYIRQRSVKRSVRGNKIPKTDARRIAKLMSDPAALEEVNGWDGSRWLNFIDTLVLDLGFVNYDTKGKYLGYTSSDVSYTENYINFNESAYKKFLARPMQKQEQKLFDIMIGDFGNSNNEFIRRSLFGRLNMFSQYGCATGVIPHLNFDNARIFLFNCLKSCQVGIWYDTASLVRYLKKTYPFFLIPKNPKYKYKSDRKEGRYCNFHEHKKDEWGESKVISEKADDAFERVEGRFVERFLEHIPLTLGYVELAYGEQANPGQHPSIGCLKGFKVNESFLRFMNGQIPEPRVTVQPNHEIHVESEYYPAEMLSRLAPFTDLVTTDRICILKLNKKKAVKYLAENESADLKKIIGDQAENPLPPNIAAELDEWVGHSETFLLYQEFGLLEGSSLPKFVKKFEEEKLSSSLRLIRSPDELFSELEMAGQIPILLTHRNNGFKKPPDKVQSVFKQKAAKKKKKTAKKELISIRQKTYVTLFFQTSELLNVFVKALVLEKCPVEVDKVMRSATYASEHSKMLNTALKKLKKTYRIKIEE